ncbi:MAG TPA: hypothetical protein VJ779_14915 [Acetobacteraceae bacterium]|nr:hypothetical protein [Acetobacteraceae bacterium]
MPPLASIEALKPGSRAAQRLAARERAATPLSAPLALRAPADAPAEPIASRRAKIWEFDPNLHCSIIGTCLSAAELRRLLIKLGLARDDESDHDLHSRAVALATRRDDASRRLNKALYQQHRLAIH